MNTHWYTAFTGFISASILHKYSTDIDRNIHIRIPKHVLNFVVTTYLMYKTYSILSK